MTVSRLLNNNFINCEYSTKLINRKSNQMKFKHGKYKGQTFESILISDPEYIEYLYFDLNGGQEPTLKKWFESRLAIICFSDTRYKGESFEYILEVDPAFLCHMYDTINDLDPLFVKWFVARGMEIRKAAKEDHQTEWNEYDKIKKELGGM